MLQALTLPTPGYLTTGVPIQPEYIRVWSLLTDSYPEYNRGE